MVMARSSLHRRDETLDLVQIVPNVDKIILVFTTTRSMVNSVVVHNVTLYFSIP